MKTVDKSPFSPEFDGCDSEFDTLYGGDPGTRVLFKTERFAVLCDQAPVSAGHLLVVTIDPLFSFAHVPEPHWDDLLRIKSRVFTNLQRNYGTPVFLEHGSAPIPGGGGGGCVSHAHWHAVPVPAPIDLVPKFKEQGFVLTEIEDPRHIIRWAETESPYLYFESTEGIITVAENVEGIPRQYLRMKVAEAIGLEWPKWDRHAFVNKDLLRESVRTLGKCDWDVTKATD